MELRKRKAPEAAPAPVKKAAKAKTEKKEEKPKEDKKAEKAPAKAPAKKTKDTDAAPPFPEVGSTIDLDTFGGEIETNDGEKTTLKKLVEASGSGVVLFTYPKASTPGCTYSLRLPI